MDIQSKEIHSLVKPISKITDKEKLEMFHLMTLFYDNVTEEVFLNDLMDKDYCIMLYNEQNHVKGFSTQKEISLELNGKTVYGIFSGDTIIHKDYWGSPELFKEFARSFVKEHDEEYYWFLISKGYKTYKMLPLFFKEFYPNYQSETPIFEKAIIDKFGLTNHPLDYNQNTGVNEYKLTKDKLKDGVADITEKQLADKDIQYFTEINPGYIKGYDLVCITKLNKQNLKNLGKRLFRGV